MEEHTSVFAGDPTSLMMLRYSNSPEASSGGSHETGNRVGCDSRLTQVPRSVRL